MTQLLEWTRRSIRRRQLVGVATRDNRGFNSRNIRNCCYVYHCLHHMAVADLTLKMKSTKRSVIDDHDSNKKYHVKISTYSSQKVSEVFSVESVCRFRHNVNSNNCVGTLFVLTVYTWNRSCSLRFRITTVTIHLQCPLPLADVCTILHTDSKPRLTIAMKLSNEIYEYV